MPIPLGRGPARGERDVLEPLTGCHRKIEQFLGILSALAARGPHLLDDVEREALGSALRYFREGAPLHTQDEERSLFPRLRASGDPAAADVIDEIERLEADHVRADDLHAQVDDIGRAWLADGSLPEGDAAAFRRAVQELELLYRAHIAVEDARVFPLAAHLLDRAAWEEIGHEIARRRGG